MPRTRDIHTAQYKEMRRRYYDERVANWKPLPEGTLLCCRTCRRSLPISVFRKNTLAKHGYRTSCNDCLRESDKEKMCKYRDKYWARTIHRGIIRRDHYRPTENPITEEHILDLWEKQGGRCYWLNIPMLTRAKPNLGHREPRLVSLERLDNSKGYEIGNVVLACMFANVGRNTTPADSFLAFLDEIKACER